MKAYKIIYNEKFFIELYWIESISNALTPKYKTEYDKYATLTHSTDLGHSLFFTRKLYKPNYGCAICMLGLGSKFILNQTRRELLSDINYDQASRNELIFTVFTYTDIRTSSDNLLDHFNGAAEMYGGMEFFNVGKEVALKDGAYNHIRQYISCNVFKDLTVHILTLNSLTHYNRIFYNDISHPKYNLDIDESLKPWEQFSKKWGILQKLDAQNKYVIDPNYPEYLHSNTYVYKVNRKEFNSSKEYYSFIENIAQCEADMSKNGFQNSSFRMLLNDELKLTANQYIWALNENENYLKHF